MFQHLGPKHFPLREEIVFGRCEEPLPAYLTSGPLPVPSRGLGDLDPSQQAALKHALTNRLAIIQVSIPVRIILDFYPEISEAGVGSDCIFDSKIFDN